MYAFKNRRYNEMVFLSTRMNFTIKPQKIMRINLYFYGLPSQLCWQRICLQCRRPQFDSWVRRFPWRRDRLPSLVFLDFPCSSAGKESTCNVGDPGSIRGLGISSGERKGCPLQYSGGFHGLVIPWTVQSIGSQRVRHDFSLVISKL